MEVVEAVLGMVEGVSLGKVQVVGEKAVVTWPPVASPVRDDLVSGGGWDVYKIARRGLLVQNIRPTVWKAWKV